MHPWKSSIQWQRLIFKLFRCQTALPGKNCTVSYKLQCKKIGRNYMMLNWHVLYFSSVYLISFFYRPVNALAAECNTHLTWHSKHSCTCTYRKLITLCYSRDKHHQWPERWKWSFSKSKVYRLTHAVSQQFRVNMIKGSCVDSTTQCIYGNRLIFKGLLIEWDMNLHFMV